MGDRRWGDIYFVTVGPSANRLYAFICVYMRLYAFVDVYMRL